MNHFTIQTQLPGHSLKCCCCCCCCCCTPFVAVLSHCFCHGASVTAFLVPVVVLSLNCIVAAVVLLQCCCYAFLCVAPFPAALCMADNNLSSPAALWSWMFTFWLLVRIQFVLLTAVCLSVCLSVALSVCLSVSLSLPLCVCVYTFLCV